MHPTDVVYMPYKKAESVLRNQGLEPVVTFQTGSEANKWLVTNQVPAAGASVRKHTVVRLTVSRGPAPVFLNYVVGDSLDSIKAQIRSAGFRLHVVYKASPNAAVPVGTVLSQSLSSGDYPYGTTVTLTVAHGLKLVKLPPAKAIVGQAIQPVRDLLTAAGFVINPVNEFSSTVPVGNVITTQPSPGTKRRVRIDDHTSHLPRPRRRGPERGPQDPGCGDGRSSERPPHRHCQPGQRSGHRGRLGDEPVLGPRDPGKWGTTVVIYVQQPSPDVVDDHDHSVGIGDIRDHALRGAPAQLRHRPGR